MFIPVQWPSYDAVVVFYADSGLGQRRAVRRLEGAEILRTDLDAAVASQQFGIEEYAYFRNPGMTFGILGRGDLYGRDQVFLAVGAWHPDWNWLPVNTTGLARFSNMKLRADAEYAIVSVPCRTTNPSYSS